MAVDVDRSLPVRPVSLAEYHRMVDADVFEADARLELIEGVTVEMSPQSGAHANAVEWLAERLSAVVGRGHVRAQLPLTLTAARSEPEPDIALVAVDVPRRPHPVAALLVVEVAVSSLTLDLGPKARVYATAGVPEFWVVDLAAAVLVVHRSPAEDRYAEVVRAPSPDTIAPLAFPDVPVDLAALFAFAG